MHRRTLVRPHPDVLVRHAGLGDTEGMHETHITPTDDSQRRMLELEALYETAGDLSSLRDVDEVLAAIVRRGRQLLASDVAYLMLIEEERQEAYMRVADGIQTPAFMSIRLAYGEGLGGLVASTQMPQWTSDYRTDPRWAPKIDTIVRGEALQAILGVPLMVGRRVIGVLFASDRRSRTFAHAEVALLSSLANHAAIALENASLHEASRQALRKWQEANRRVEEQNRMLERAADLHERLTALVLDGEPLETIAAAVADAIGGEVVVLGPDGAPLTPVTDGAVLPSRDELEQLVADRAASVPWGPPTGAHARVAPARAGTRQLGYLLRLGPALSATDVRSLERAALVTALLLLDLRAEEEALGRAMSELIAELENPLAEEEHIRERAAAAGVRVGAPPYAALVARAPNGRRLDVVAPAVARGGIARSHGGEAFVVLPSVDAGTAARELSAELGAGHHRPVTVGGTGPYPSLSTAVRALSRAAMCAKVLETTGQVGRGASPEELGVYTLLFSDAGRDQIEEFVTETLGAVRRYDAARGSELVRTLEAYFDAGGQTGVMAEALFVHVNTLYQRLDRLTQLLGEGWRCGERSLQIHLALRLGELLRRAV